MTRRISNLIVLAVLAVFALSGCGAFLDIGKAVRGEQYSSAPRAVEHDHPVTTTIQDQMDVSKSTPRSSVDREYLLVYNLDIKHIRNGQVIDERSYHNLVTTVGKAGVAARINGYGSPAAYTYIAIGTGTNAASASDTTLQTEITTNGGQRAVATTIDLVTTTTTNDTARLVVTFSFTGSFAVTESGVLNAASNGTLLAHRVFSAINVNNGDSLQITWKTQCS